MLFNMSKSPPSLPRDAWVPVRLACLYASYLLDKAVPSNAEAG